MVRAAPLRHPVPCFGYVIDEPDQAGRMDVDKATALGLPPGKEYKYLKEGRSVQTKAGEGMCSWGGLGSCCVEMWREWIPEGGLKLRWCLSGIFSGRRGPRGRGRGIGHAVPDLFNYKGKSSTLESPRRASVCRRDAV